MEDIIDLTLDSGNDIDKDKDISTSKIPKPNKSTKRNIAMKKAPTTQAKGDNSTTTRVLRGTGKMSTGGLGNDSSKNLRPSNKKNSRTTKVNKTRRRSHGSLQYLQSNPWSPTQNPADNSEASDIELRSAESSDLDYSSQANLSSTTDARNELDSTHEGQSSEVEFSDYIQAPTNNIDMDHSFPPETFDPLLLRPPTPNDNLNSPEILRRLAMGLKATANDQIQLFQAAFKYEDEDRAVPDLDEPLFEGFTTQPWHQSTQSTGAQVAQGKKRQLSRETSDDEEVKLEGGNGKLEKGASTSTRALTSLRPSPKKKMKHSPRPITSTPRHQFNKPLASTSTLNKETREMKTISFIQKRPNSSETLSVPGSQRNTGVELEILKLLKEVKTPFQRLSELLNNL